MARPLDARLLDACVEGCAATHQKLLEVVDSIAPEAFSEPSRLPGWSKGTIVGHLALNAQSHIHLLSCAARGESGHQYVGGPDARTAAIAEASQWAPEKAVSELRKATLFEIPTESWVTP
jgi:maleylpyruvate isomerase